MDIISTTYRELNKCRFIQLDVSMIV